MSTERLTQSARAVLDAWSDAGWTPAFDAARQALRAEVEAAEALAAVPVEPRQITEAMHVAACKVLTRASGLDGTPQRMLDAMLAAAPQPQQADWRDHVEQRLMNWRQRTMNKSGDRLALDDFMDKESLADLLDYVLDEYATPPPQPTAPATQAHRLSLAAQDVLAERQRQISVEGWTPEHDDKHNDCQLAAAAACYAVCANQRHLGEFKLMGAAVWPWFGWWKPKDYRSNLIKSGALILAEIERLDRASAAQKEPTQKHVPFEWEGHP